MSESRNSESRNYGFVYNRGSESRGNESRTRNTPVYPTFSSAKLKKSEQSKYNDLDSIDELIERLEKEIPMNTSVSERVNSAYAARRRKIEELKKLQQQAREEQERQQQIAKAEEELSSIEQGNNELDAAIAKVKKMIKPSESSYYGSGESRSSESRW